LNILIDLYKTKDLYSGLGQYSLNFANELMRQCPEDLEVNLLIPPRFNQARHQGTRYIRSSFRERYFPVLNPKYQLWHSLHQFPSHFPHPSTKFILTVHDLNFLTEKKGHKAKRYLNRLQKNVDKATAITVISEYTGKILKEHINLQGKLLKIIHDGVLLETRPDVQRPAWLNEKPFFFSLSVFKATKNVHALIPLMNYFPGHNLVLAGYNHTPYGEKVRELINRSGLSGNILLPGTINNDEKYWLYRNCQAFLFPSLAEGFGLPVIEAMLAGKPVFLSRLTSLPETGGDKAFYWNTFEPSEMAEIMQTGLEMWEPDASSRSSDIAAYASRFSWQNCIRKFLELYKDIGS